jgi:5'-nucleotidase/UDP-sugar diphosphatase
MPNSKTMKPGIVLAFVLLVISQATNSQEGKRLIILHTNDFHSHLQGFAPESAYTPLIDDNDPTIGGFSRIAGLISETRAASPSSTLVLDAGDCHMGTLFQALEPETGFQLDIMKKAGYDVVALGNHDFDFGIAKYAEIVRSAVKNGEIPILLSGNSLTDPVNPADDDFEALLSDSLMKRTTIIEKEGLKIGLFSLLGKDADESATYASPITFKKIIPAARERVKELKKLGCDVIICLSHSGVIRDKHGNWSGEDVRLAKKVKGIDIIISGHMHVLLEEPVIVKGIPIVCTGDNGRYVGKAELLINDGKVKLDKYEMIQINDRIRADSLIQSDINEQITRIDQEILKPVELGYAQPIAKSDFILKVEEEGDLAGSNLGAMVADAIYYYMNSEGPGADIAIVAQGVIRDPIMPGTETVADLFKTMSLGAGNDQIPGYPLSKLWITGKELKSLAEILIFLSKSTPSNFCYYSHLKIEYDPEGRIFNKVRKITLKDSDGNFTEVSTSKDDVRLYSVVADSYMVDNLPLIKKKTFGLISVVPKDENGRQVNDTHTRIADFDAVKPGVQEGKEWLALVRYLQQFPPQEEAGLPVIPEQYEVADRSLVPVSKNK